MTAADSLASKCPRCGATFECGQRAGKEPCWCAELPPVLAVPSGNAPCYCRRCLEELAAIARAHKT